MAISLCMADYTLKDDVMAEPGQNAKILALTAEIVSAHLAFNIVSTDLLPNLIQDVYRSLNNAGLEPEVAKKLQPAVPVKKSVFPDYIICLEDGKQLKMLKRHLKTAYNMTPKQYRERWGLAADYPMVAPSYASHRSTLARQIGLGTKSRIPN